MRHLPDGWLHFSPSDLLTFLQGEFAAWMERAYAERHHDSTFPRPDEGDLEMALIREKGMEHEASVLTKLEALHGPAVRFDKEEDGTKTLAALQSGKTLIYQGRLDDGCWHGYPDFLLRSETPSRLGSWSYRPLDSKLARSAKPYFLVQLCAYAQYVEAAQQLRPAQLAVLLGNGEERAFDTERFFYFYRHLRDTFLEFQEGFDPSAQPDPALEKNWGRWESAAVEILENRDDLRLIARITRSQIKRLRQAAIATRAALVQSSGPIRRLSDDVLVRLRRQARLQIASKGKGNPAFEVLPHDPGQRVGLATLPPPSAGDVFFDLEGNPLAKDGLEYLFGAVTVENGTPTFHDWWAHNEAEEKLAFEQVVDWLHDQLRNHPDMHVYHYANYEVAALERLMGKYATRENAVDDLLRGDVFVDLYAVTRNGVAIGTDGYSLKDIEVLFAPKRTALVMDAASSTVEYSRWLGSGESPNWRESPILQSIRDYNREDCEFTWRLAQWLRDRQREAGIAYIRQPLAETEAPKEPRAEDLLAEQLLASAQDDVTRLVAWLLGYHRREDKPMWWRFFDRLEATPEDLYDDPECLANVKRTSRQPRKVKRSFLFEYEFDPDQDTKLDKGSPVYVLDGTTEQPKRDIASIDLDAGRLEILFGPKATPPEFCHLIPNDYINSQVLRDALQRFGERWLAEDQDTYRAAADLLHRRRPRLTGRQSGEPLLPAPPTFPDDLISLIRSLDGTTLCIQGPPGAGKTHNAAAAIVALATAGARIGVSSNSHKAIINLLTAVSDETRRQSKALLIYKAGDETAEELDRRITPCTSKEVDEKSTAEGVVVGGSAWVFAREELEQRFDYLFIDEAGQVCLANAVAMGLSAKNIILIGDQMQLSQPAQAVHPGKSGWSSLHYFLEGHATIPPDLGVLLPITWRLHPVICRFISDTAYDGRLDPDGKNAERSVVLPTDVKLLTRGTGIMLSEIEHDGNTQSSEEEANRIKEYVDEMRRGRVRDEDGEREFNVAKDLLIVAPYNAQVRLLKQRLADATIRIASVDKFQGQQASVVILSMCASSLEETARGPKFLLDPRRLNVALSRARCLAIVVASSKLVRTRPNSVDEMELFNLYCRLRYYARELEVAGVEPGHMS